MKIGNYESRIVKKGVEETTIGVPEGHEYYVIQMDKFSQLDVKTQAEAEIISRLIKIEKLLAGKK